METKLAAHTKGPWKVERYSSTLEVWPVAGGSMIASFQASPQFPGQRDEAEANAALVAASPRLLEALRLYVKLDSDRRAGCSISADDWAECYQAAKTAISEAEGG